MYKLKYMENEKEFTNKTLLAAGLHVRFNENKAYDVFQEEWRWLISAECTNAKQLLKS